MGGGVVRDPMAVPKGTAGSDGRDIAFVTRHQWPWLRQIDDAAGRHGGMTVRLGFSEQANWLVVFDDLAAPLETDLPKERRILFAHTPPVGRRHRPGFINQFGILASPTPVGGFTGRWVASQPARPWRFGVRVAADSPAIARADLTVLRAMPAPELKARRMSVICCGPMPHKKRERARQALLAQLRLHFADDVDIYGDGFLPVQDTATAILPYRYHLVLEDTDLDHCWTERLADAYLGFALPLYAGCANVIDYFPRQALVPLPALEDRPAILRVIAEVLAKDPWADRLDAIRVARSGVLDRHNLFSLIERWTAPPKTGKAAARERLEQPQLILPAVQCGRWATLLRRIGLR